MAESWGAAQSAGGDAWSSAPTAATEDTTPAAPTAEDEAKKAEKAEQIKKARDAGWTETTAFNYGEFMRTGGEPLSFSFPSRSL